jgi:curved DNA-binding protein CbpA
MSIEPDPYRVLGLGRGASADEIRRAYRRLVKENHPDSAGEKALPRFLAIQAAYEALAGGPSIRRAGGRGAASSRATARDPWRADPDRARTTRESARRPGRPGWGSGPNAGSGQNAGSGRAGSTGSTGSTGPAAAPGPTSSSGGPRRRPRPESAGGPPGAGPAGPSGGSARRGGDSVGSSRRPAGDRPPRDGRKRAPNKATLGSTSYDAADDEPFEPEWSGGTWYGASSGTYWTINPKEYADPRKHGEEYQRRARRRSAADRVLGSEGSGEGPDFGESGPASDPQVDGQSAEPDEPQFTDRADGESPPPGEAASGRATGRSRGSDGRQPSPRASPTAGSTSPWAGAAASTPTQDPSDGLDPFEAAAHVAMSLARTPRGFMARIGLALLGWPAIGLALTTAAGEITGCGRFAASCVDLFGVGTWLGQLVIIAVLLALPSVAALSAVGSLVALAASVPTAVILSATGGSREAAASAMVLGAVLVLAYTLGVVVALVRRRSMAPVP